jgi:hypothetical protein
MFTSLQAIEVIPNQILINFGQFRVQSAHAQDGRWDSVPAQAAKRLKAVVSSY